MERRDALAKMFGAKGVRVNTNRGEAYYESLRRTMEKRLKELRNSPAASKVDS